MKRKSIIYLLSLVIIAVCVINVIRISKVNDKLRSNGIIVFGTVISCHLRAKSGNTMDVRYRFIYNNTPYTSESMSLGIAKKNFVDNFIGKSFPIIIMSDNPNESEILITPDRFKRFGVKFPDSLNWVLKYWTKDYRRFD